MQVVRAIGGRAPLHLTSVGKLFLAHDDAQRVRAYATRTGLAGPHPQQHHRAARGWSASWPRCSQYGTARDDEELELGVRCMAAGILDDQGKLVAGLSISAPADRLEEAWLERLQRDGGADLGDASGTAAERARQRAARRDQSVGLALSERRHDG